MAIKVMEIEFTEQINPIRQLEQYEGVRILVRYRGRPLWAGLMLVTIPGNKQFPLLECDKQLWIS